MSLLAVIGKPHGKSESPAASERHGKNSYGSDS